MARWCAWVVVFGVAAGWPARAGAADGPASGDWPQWGGTPARNMASGEKNLPDTFDPGRRADAPNPLPGGKNLSWVAKLGSQTYGGPVVANGRVFVGTNSAFPGVSVAGGASQRGGVVACFEQATGKLLWKLHSPRYVTNVPLFNFDHLSAGVCSTPTVEGDRVYVVSNRGEVLCLDVQGQANGNDGPFQDEARYQAGTGAVRPLEPTDADILWRFDMLTEPQVRSWPQDAANCSVLIWKDLAYVCPSNGVDRSHKHIPRPNCPSLIALDKRTGALVAADDVRVGAKILHGEWSSPSFGQVNGRGLVFHGGGDGVCYAFDATPSPGPDGQMLLRKVWSYDCNPPRYRVRDGKPLPYKHAEGPSEIIATPVFDRNRVYVAIGQDPAHKRGAGCLSCIDATKTGDITGTGKVWSYEKIERSLSTVSIADGLVYAADYGGFVHCLDAETGQPQWVYEGKSAVWGSTLVADGKVYLGNERGELLVLAAGRQMKLLNKVMLGSRIYTTPVAANGMLFVATHTHLFAAKAQAP